jgi:ABC-2 type transport system permease protein
LPGWLEPIAENNPFTTMVDAARALFLDTPAGNDVWGAIAWCAAIIAVFGPPSAWRYRRAVTR